MGLEHLDLSENKIKTIEMSTFENASLKSLDLSNNQIEQSHGILALNSVPQTLILAGNCIETLSQKFLEFGSEMEYFDLGANPINCYSTDFQNHLRNIVEQNDG
jgi:Leucine-rich repeat (LRR) protein